MSSQPEPARLTTLTEWLNASPAARAAGVHTCVDRIRGADGSIQAWVQVQPQPPTGDGTLSGIPFGAKDVIETRGLASEFGSPIYKGQVGSTDAGIVRELRSRGAVLLGKTQCAAFAYFDPPATRNPRNLEHTPGGSSSGSAAAVAADMVPLAIGTQTLGSVLRPASYCGVTGFKPTYGLLAMEGVLPLSTTLDTLGFFTHTADDMLALWEALGQDATQTEDCDLAVPEPLPEVESAMASAFRHAVATLRRAGARIRAIDIAAVLAKLNEAAMTVMFYEGARFHESRFREHGARLGRLGELVRQGLQISAERYDQTRRFIDGCRGQIGELFQRTPVIVLPASTGPAPHGLSSTGDPRMSAPWTALGTPAISIPMAIHAGLPLGMQVVAAGGDDARVLHTATRIQKMLA